MYKKFTRAGLIVMLAASMIFGGCGKKDSKGSESSAVESQQTADESSSSAENTGAAENHETPTDVPTEVPTDTPAVTPTEAPIPTPMPVPDKDHDGHVGRRELNCLKDKGLVLGVDDAGKDRILAEFFTNEAVYDENNESKGLKRKYCLVDTAKDEVIAECISESSSEEFVGAGENGNIIFYAPAHKKLVIYSGELKVTKEIPLEYCRNIVYDSASDKIYTVEGETLVSIDADGNRQTILEKANRTDIIGGTYFFDKLLISDPGYYTETEKEYSLFDIGTGKAEKLYDCEAEDSVMSGSSVLSISYSNERETTISSYDFMAKKENGAFKYDDKIYKCFDSNLPVSVFYYAHSANGETVKYILMVKPEDGSYALIDDLHSFDIELAADKETGHIYLVATTTGAGNVFYEICPETLDFGNKLEQTVIEKKEHTDSACSDPLKEVREKFDEIEEEYGISILIGDEINGWDLGTEYELISTDAPIESGSWAVTEFYGFALDTFKEGLNRYPKGFFDKYKDYRGTGGLRFFLVADILNKSGDFVADGFANNTGCYSNIVLHLVKLNEETLHHEIWHSVEAEIVFRAPDAFDEKKWGALNPAGFSYGKSKDSYYDDAQQYIKYCIDWNPENEEVYFNRDYSTLNSMEDRATLLEHVMVDENSVYDDDMPMTIREYIFSRPHLADKLSYMQSQYEKWFGDIYWK